MVYGFLYVLLPLHILTKPNLFLSLENNKSTKKYTLCSGDLFFFFFFFFFLLFFFFFSGHILYKYMQGILKRIWNSFSTTDELHFMHISVFAWRIATHVVKVRKNSELYAAVVTWTTQIRHYTMSFVCLKDRLTRTLISLNQSQPHTDWPISRWGLTNQPLAGFPQQAKECVTPESSF